MLKVALTYLDKGTAIGRCTLETAKVLNKYVDLTCYVTDRNKLNEEFKKIGCPVKIFHLKRGGKNLLKAIFTGKEDSGMAAEIIKDNPDIVMDGGTLNWFRVIERMLGGRFPVVEVVHDSTPHPGFEYVLYSLQRKLHPSLCDCVVSISEFCYRDNIRRLPDKKHILSRHGVNAVRDDVDHEEVGRNSKNQLMFGRIEKYKGVEVLVDAYEYALKEVPDLKVTIAGAGKIAPAVLRKAERLGINILNKFIDEKELRRLTDSHGVMLMPYTSATQSGVAAAAMENCLPCVATDVGALPEQVIDGETGIIVPMGDAKAFADGMVAMATNPKRVAEMSRKCVVIEKRDFNWETIGKKLAEDLEKFYGEYKK